MTRKVFTVDEQTPLSEVAALMDQHKIKHARAQISRTSSDLPPELSAKLLSMCFPETFNIGEILLRHKPRRFARFGSVMRLVTAKWSADTRFSAGHPMSLMMLPRLGVSEYCFQVTSCAEVLCKVFTLF